MAQCRSHNSLNLGNESRARRGGLRETEGVPAGEWLPKGDEHQVREAFRKHTLDGDWRRYVKYAMSSENRRYRKCRQPACQQSRLCIGMCYRPRSMVCKDTFELKSLLPTPFLSSCQPPPNLRLTIEKANSAARAFRKHLWPPDQGPPDPLRQKGSRTRKHNIATHQQPSTPTAPHSPPHSSTDPAPSAPSPASSSPPRSSADSASRSPAVTSPA